MRTSATPSLTEVKMFLFYRLVFSIPIISSLSPGLESRVLRGRTQERQYGVPKYNFDYTHVHTKYIHPLSIRLEEILDPVNSLSAYNE